MKDETKHHLLENQELPNLSLVHQIQKLVELRFNSKIVIKGIQTINRSLRKTKVPLCVK
jgi:negative regulator of sigma E activity